MIFDISVAMTWILFLALFPISFFWLRRAWRIMVKRDFSEVALKKGVPPPDPERFATFAALINLVGGAMTVFAISLVLVFQAEYDVWSAVAGVTIWCKFILDFAHSRHAHLKSGAASRLTETDVKGGQKG
ncbi:MAG: hypothetical protein RBT55_02935 [Rhodocyclaceae bacterium]|jgi:hypothetical protein|nr:hypothetical protein [Rhodocyclaceae bacterium]